MECRRRKAGYLPSAFCGLFPDLLEFESHDPYAKEDDCKPKQDSRFGQYIR